MQISHYKQLPCLVTSLLNLGGKQNLLPVYYGLSWVFSHYLFETKLTRCYNCTFTRYFVVYFSSDKRDLNVDVTLTCVASYYNGVTGDDLKTLHKSTKVSSVCKNTYLYVQWCCEADFGISFQVNKLKN